MLACALSLCSAAAFAQDSGAQSFTIDRSNPDAVIRFHGIRLADAHTDLAKNEIVLDFDGPADRNLFDQLELALPDWVDMAYAGDNSAVIRAVRPVTFMTAAVEGGFALRMVESAQPAQNGPYLRGQIGGPYGPVAINGRPPAPALRGPDYGYRRDEAVVTMIDEEPLSLTQGIDAGAPDPQLGGFLSASGQWREPSHAHIYESALAGALPLIGRVKLLFEAHDSDVLASAVQRLAGTVTPYKENVLSGALGLGYEVDGMIGPGEARGEALWGMNGWGGLLAYAERDSSDNWGGSIEYHAPLNDTAEQVADRAEVTRTQFGLSHHIADGFWGQAVFRVSRYGVKGDDAVARTWGATASLRYVTNFTGIWAGIGYEFNGDYLFGHHDYKGASPVNFIPLGIRNIEVHAGSASLSAEIWNGLWADAYGGYAYDRYGPDGFFGGGDLRYTLGQGWALTLSGGRTAVSTRQGELGPITTANVKLIYDWDANNPIMPLASGFFRDVGGWL